MSPKSGLLSAAVTLLSSICISHVIPGGSAQPVSPAAPVIPAAPANPIVQNPPPPPLPTLPAASVQATCGQMLQGQFSNGATIGISAPYAADLIFYINGDVGLTISSIKAYNKNNAVTALAETPLYAVNYIKVPEIAINDKIIFDVSGTGAGIFWALVRCTERITTTAQPTGSPAPPPTAQPTPPPVPPVVVPVAPVTTAAALPSPPANPGPNTPANPPANPPPPPVGPVPVQTGPGKPIASVPPVPSIPAGPVTPAIQCQCGQAFNGQFTGGKLTMQAVMSVTGSMTLYINNIGVSQIRAFNLAYNNNIAIAATPRPGIHYLSLPNIQVNTNMKFEVDGMGPPGTFYALIRCRKPTPAPTTPAPTMRTTTTTMISTTAMSSTSAMSSSSAPQTT